MPLKRINKDAHSSVYAFILLITVLLSSYFVLRIFFDDIRSSRNSSDNARGSFSSFPSLIIWAWERPEHLGFIDPDRVGVAALLKTLYLSGDSVVERPRLQPLDLPEGAKVIGVIRIEDDPNNPPTYSVEQVSETARAVVETRDGSKIDALQVDFDARVSQRGFYAKVLRYIREDLGYSGLLSITALASWCIHDDWITHLPIDDAVPMLFRMGSDRGNVIRYIQGGRDFSPGHCRGSVGISTDEPLKKLPLDRRVYVFNSEPWSPKMVTEALEEVER